MAKLERSRGSCARARLQNHETSPADGEALPVRQKRWSDPVAEPCRPRTSLVASGSPRMEESCPLSAHFARDPDSRGRAGSGTTRPNASSAPCSTHGTTPRRTEGRSIAPVPCRPTFASTTPSVTTRRSTSSLRSSARLRGSEQRLRQRQLAPRFAQFGVVVERLTERSVAQHFRTRCLFELTARRRARSLVAARVPAATGGGRQDSAVRREIAIDTTRPATPRRA